MPTNKEQITNILKEKVKQRIMREAASLIKKDMNAYNTLSSSGVASSTGIAAESKTKK